ncbi:hypothetical protein KUCAC02_032142, partial [Chaenocephalus aceratus]
LWSAAAIVSSDLASRRVTRLSGGSAADCQTHRSTSLQQKSRHPCNQHETPSSPHPQTKPSGSWDQQL